MYQIFLIFIAIHRVVETVEGLDVNGMDLLLPYHGHHGPRHSNRYVRSCQQAKYGDMTYSIHAAYKSNGSDPTDIPPPLVISKYMIKKYGDMFSERHITIHYQLINYPWQTLSVLEPLEPNSCNNKNSSVRATVLESAKRMNCLAATNAGFFNTHTGECVGNVVSNAHLVKDSGGIQNVHFGITKDGMLYFGYLSEIDIVAKDFIQLVGGVIWLIRDGNVYVDESAKLECSESQESGNIQRFVSVISARNAVGHDKEGRVIMVQVDGETGKHGINLYELADLMKDLGAVNAINLDGGGSVTLVMNGTLVNNPSDMCSDKKFRCPREVSTILCVHEPLCDPTDCNGHGQCVFGRCNCSGFWSGDQCQTVKCENDCSEHGKCTEAGCLCTEGWMGDDCHIPCPHGRYGVNCSQLCLCQHNSTCDLSTGACTCPPGFVGEFCQEGCPFGFYGDQCKHVCMCPAACGCDHITGRCIISSAYSKHIFQASNCLAQKIIQHKHLIVDRTKEYRFYVYGFISMSIVAAVSILISCCSMYTLYKDDKFTCFKKCKLPQKNVKTHKLLDNSRIYDEDEDKLISSELDLTDEV
ncbi:N-acetylglucosamine-1-phosphodiester alpha-N-acetylglucosaminidase isoform X2 [Octopus bimaculoides]|uniref:EGF-like domain-containing protein n=1 Tax=Octopus bimaculoides TaxID=37653 RepID=A0A0L8HD63_OCTBM|nr:N-acetylglucosamine-1-phosphodiester alpha-N-acetylglucosaminidase isoform X2 [Octopus bimaculoides]|eukprot:XP_014773319.1 PREDICTED: N-acetylglucosamine-1-phosphodiester alpha-N-acetylglucosaminidase-like isoform X3 [Octopus bimaculoides]